MVMTPAEAQQEVEELTDQLHNESSMEKYRAQLQSAGFDVKQLLMAGFYESEDADVWAAFVRRSDASSWYLEANWWDEITLLEQRSPDELFEQFPAIHAAVEMAARLARC